MVQNRFADAMMVAEKISSLDFFDKNRLVTAFHFFSSVLVASSSGHAILYLCIALECLLGWDVEVGRESSKYPESRTKKARIASRLEMIVGGNYQKRKAALQFVDDLYTMRNKIAHGSEARVDHVWAGRMIAQGSIYLKQAFRHSATSFAN